MSKLNADDLGEKGEARFKEICADASLVCNKSDRDRTGWDFIVEFPFETDSDTFPSLEVRRTPLSCHVQIKTVLKNTNKIQLRLSSAERLAKEIKPTFIYILRTNDDLNFSDAYLIHILGKPLGKILKRLRKEDAAGNKNPNKKTISFSTISDGISLAPSGQELKLTLAKICGIDLHEYSIRKKDQLGKLGFEERPFSASMTFEKIKTTDLVDTFLGIKRNVPVINLKATQKRFGIKLPLPSHSDAQATVNIDPSPIDTCTITARSTPFSKPAVFRGKVFIPAIPNLPPEYRKVRIDAGLFSIILFADGGTITNEVDVEAQTPSVWASYWRMHLLMVTGIGTIQVKSDTLGINENINIQKQPVELSADECKYWINTCDELSKLFELCGLIEEPKLPMEQISEISRKIHSAYRLLYPSGDHLFFRTETETDEKLRSLQTAEMIYIDFIVLGAITIAYSAKMSMNFKHNGDKTLYESNNIEINSMEIINNFPMEFDNFILEAQRKADCTNAYIVRPQDITLI